MQREKFYKLTSGQNTVIIPEKQFINLLTDIFYFHPDVNIYNQDNILLRKKDAIRNLSINSLKKEANKILSSYK